MNDGRRARYRRLLRWYPTHWRRANGDIMLDTLEENADALGLTRPRPAEAWSIRAHGLATRVTPEAILTLAGAALILGAAPLVALMLGATSDAAWVDGARSGVQHLGALLACIAMGGMLLRAGSLRPESALAAGALSVPAFAFGALTATSISLGFDVGDGERPPSWLSESTLPLLLAGWAFGALAVLCLVTTMLPGSRATRLLLGLVVALPSSLILGVMLGMQPTVVVIGAVFLLVAASLQLRRNPRILVARAVAVPLSSIVRRRIALVAVVAAVLGFGCAAFALTGSIWFPAVGDSTSAMRVGLPAGACVAIITVLAGATVLRARLGRVVFGPTMALVAALLALAGSYAVDSSSPLSWSLMLAAGALAGLAGGLAFAPLLPGGALLRPLLVLCVSVAAALTFGLGLITMATFIAPVLAVVLAVLMLRKPKVTALPVAA